MFRVTRTMISKYGKWSFENKKFLILNFALGGTYPVKINGFKKAYYGLDPKTVKIIKENKAKMFVDWVKAIQH